MKAIELGVCGVPRSLETARDLAQRAEAAGMAWFGVADSPVLFCEPLMAILAAAEATEHINVGTLITNPVTRHASVQASAFRTLEAAAPGRLFVGIGPGDSAVHSVGLEPGSPASVQDYVEAMGRYGCPDMPVIVACGGPKAARVAGTYADHILLGQGVSETASELVGSSAIASARDAGRPDPRLWGFVALGLAPTTAELDRTRNAVRAVVAALSRQALSVLPIDKGLPPELADDLAVFLAEYEFAAHSVPGETANALALAKRPALDDYLMARFAVVDTPERAAERLAEAAQINHLSGLFLCIEVPDPAELLTMIEKRLMPRFEAV